MRLKEVIEKVGKDRIEEFLDFMRGQTVGVYDDGEANYYKCDVENFLRDPKDRFWD